MDRPGVMSQISFFSSLFSSLFPSSPFLDRHEEKIKPLPLRTANQICSRSFPPLPAPHLKPTIEQPSDIRQPGARAPSSLSFPPSSSSGRTVCRNAPCLPSVYQCTSAALFFFFLFFLHRVGDCCESPPSPWSSCAPQTCSRFLLFSFL